MDEVITRDKKPATFNGPLEVGIRAVALLEAAHPRVYDIQRLTGLDYLVVHTADIGGPDSLHPPTPLQSAELLVRRKLVEKGVLLMMSRGLVEREVSSEGIRYRAGENAAPFLAALQSDYMKAVKERAVWIVAALGDQSDQEFRNLMRKFFDQWVEEFQTAQRSMGAES